MLIKVQKLIEEMSGRKTELAAICPTVVQSVERESIQGWPAACKISFGLETMIVNERLEELVDRINGACRQEWQYVDGEGDDEE